MPSSPLPGSDPTEPRPDDIMRTCPRCDARLTERKCKLLCERCGYYMSCADYY